MYSFSFARPELGPFFYVIIFLMKKFFYPPGFVFGLFFIVILGAGCARSSPSDSAGTGTSPSNDRVQEISLRGPCEHEYYPLKPGYKVDYRSSYTASDGGYTISVTDDGPASVLLRLIFRNGTRSEQKIVCENGGLKALGYVDLANASRDGRATVETISADGYLLPQNIQIGSDWTVVFKTRMKIPVPQANNGPMVLDANVSIRQRAVAEEIVTVPAGTFRALKVLSETFMDTESGRLFIGNGDGPVVRTSEWWVKGKGMVKSVTSFASAEGIVVEATSIQTP